MTVTIRPNTSWVRLSEIIWRSGLATSKGDAKRLIEQGAIRVEGRDGVVRITDAMAVLTVDGILTREDTGR